MSDVLIEKKMFKPAVGMSSCVGIMGCNYPLSFGNYCGISGGPYLVNIWAENLSEWARRNPDVAEIEVTVVAHCGKSIGFVSDERLQDWCNKELCITGIGWATALMCRTVCSMLGASPDDWLCGCERDDQGPSQLSCSQFRQPEQVTCHHCGRNWTRTR